MSLIAHIDADCFYVSCERIRDPSLAGKAVGVLGNQGSCVIARSYEMKAKGVTVALPIHMAKRLCPEGIYIKRDFEWYGVVSHHIQDILKRFSPYVEFYSVDESFVEFKKPLEDPAYFARKIQNTVLEEARIPVSIGFAETRTLAKLGSDKNKPFGITVITADNREEILAETPVEDIFGIGRRLSVKLKEQGIHTALDFVRQDRLQILKLLHKPGECLWYELQGIPITPLKTERPIHKSLSRGGQLWGVQRDPKVIYGFAIRNLERFVEALWHNRLESLHLCMALIEENGRAVSEQVLFPDYGDEYATFLKAAQQLFSKLYKKGQTYSAVHLYATALKGSDRKQLPLFSTENPRAQQVQALKQNLAERFGPFTLRSASTAFVPQVFADTASNYEICDIDGKLCF